MNFKKLTYLCMQRLTNFPYIEEDFDALTNYELLSKVVEYLNEVIANSNEQNTAISNLYDAFTELQNYINNYFENLNVQEEINNKLDQMAADGSLTNLIKDYVDPLLETFENNVTEEINTQNNRITGLINDVQNMTSGSPAGTYATVADLTSADPDHDKIYVVLADGKWYYYNTSTSLWAAGGTYQSTSIAANSIDTPQVYHIEQNKITNSGFYVEKLVSGSQTSSTLSTSSDNKTITFAAASGAVISSGTYSGFTLYTPITEEMAASGGIMFACNTDGNNTDLVAMLPQVSYTNITVQKNSDDYFCFRTTTNIVTYLNAHIGEYLQIRVLFTNSDGISTTIKMYYIGAMGVNVTKDILGNYKANKMQPSSYNTGPQYNILPISSYSDLTEQFTFNFTSTTGSSAHLYNIDISKDLLVSVDVLSGDTPDVFLKIHKTDSSTIYKSKSLSNGQARWLPSDFSSLDQDDIDNIELVLATTDVSIDYTNYKTATIKFPIISQSPYSDKYTDTLYSIKNDIQTNNQTNRLYGSKLLVLGDSMAYGHSLSRSSVWDSLIADRNNMTLVNLAQNGKFYTRHQFVSGNVVPYTQEDLDNHLVSNIGLVDMIDDLDTNTDYIVIFCGTNDTYQHVTLGEFLDNNYTSFYGCLYKTFNSLISKYPTEKIMVITPYPRTTNYNNDYKYIDAINEVCKYFCIPVYNTFEAGLDIKNSEQAAELMLDDTHLNADGQLRQSYKIESQMKML
ncbi:MAG: SGNH/GDSL hydrolase family protein [Bacilli bacterium]|nr:SGNH/GDSL hydrolase family protein [Bacilli bacterium]